MSASRRATPRTNPPTHAGGAADSFEVDLDALLRDGFGPETKLVPSTVPADAWAPWSPVNADARHGPRYQIQHLHAQGGLGQVWSARDEQIGREVAYKRIIPERGCHGELVARFLREARITGQLEHPGIVPVYEVSRSPDDSHPFYTMRMVRGKTLSDANRSYHAARREGRDSRREFRELLGAVLAVAQAVAYAHSRGVIHRDLKGENVLVGEYGEVILLDWGLARVQRRDSAVVASGATATADADALGEVQLTAEDLPDGTLDGQVMGTPVYMAPEQARGKLDEIDERTDVYGLGAMMYEVLTGRPPFTGASSHEVLTKVLGGSPRPPRALHPGVPRALNAICVKSLAARPDDRYSSAAQFAYDLQNYLADEPVAAYRAPLWMRIGRWGRRHKPLVAGLSVLLVAAVVGLSIGTVLLRQKQKEIDAQRTRAEANFREAKSAVDRYLVNVTESRELKRVGLERLRRGLLEIAREFYDRFVEASGDDPGLRGDLGQAHLRLGNIRLALGENDDAETSYKEALEVFRELRKEEPAVMGHRYEIAALHGNLGYLYYHMGRSRPAEESLEESLVALAKLSAVVPDDPEHERLKAKVNDNLGTLHTRTGRAESAEEFYRDALQIREKLAGLNPDDDKDANALVHSCVNLATLYARTGRAQEAERYLKRAIPLGRKLLEKEPDAPQFRNALSASLDNLGGVYVLLGRLPEAREAYEQALKLKEELVGRHPQVLEYGIGLGLVCSNLGEVEALGGEHAAALPWFERATECLERGLEKEPRSATVRFYTSYAYSWRAKTLAALERRREALAAWERAIELDDRKQPSLRVGRAVALAKTGELKRAFREADALFDEKGLAPAELVALARVFALTSTDPLEAPGESDRAAEAAIEMLRRAAAAGYFRDGSVRSGVREETDFTAVREREGFHAILRDGSPKDSGR